MPLDEELATYEENRPALLAHEGKFVLIQGRRIAGLWDSYEDALKAGYADFGLMPFLVKHIQCIEQVQTFTRNIGVQDASRR